MPVMWGLVLAGWVLVLGGALFWKMAWSVPRWKEMSALFGLPQGMKPPVRMKPTSGYVNELLYRGCLTIGWDGRTLYLLPMGGRLLGMRVVGIPAERLRPGRRRSVAEDLSNWQFTWGLQWFRISGTDLKVALGKDWAQQVANAQVMMGLGEGEEKRTGPESAPP